MGWPEIIGILIAGGLVILLWRAAAKKPTAFLGGLLRNLIVGCVGLLAIDYVGKPFGVHVPLNVATAGVTGLLGLPGVIAIAIAQKWII